MGSDRDGQEMYVQSNNTEQVSNTIQYLLDRPHDTDHERVHHRLPTRVKVTGLAKSWANLRLLIGIYSQNLGPTKNFCANPVTFTLQNESNGTVLQLYKIVSADSVRDSTTVPTTIGRGFNPLSHIRS
jgi:hypothetical protein